MSAKKNIHNLMDCPDHLRPWLECETSLTERAKCFCSSVDVSLLSQEWQDDEFTREILMICDGKPWWYAYTSIPSATFKKKEHAFLTLGERPLGRLIFSDPDFIRYKSIFYPIEAHDSYYVKMGQWVKPQLDKHCLWAKKSEYRVLGEPLLLVEIFLPDVGGNK